MTFFFLNKLFICQRLMGVIRAPLLAFGLLIGVIICTPKPLFSHNDEILSGLFDCCVSHLKLDILT